MVTGSGKVHNPLAATHDHAPCVGCSDQQGAISRLEHDLRYTRGRVAELEREMQRITATPEMGRRKWTFEESTPCPE